MILHLDRSSAGPFLAVHVTAFHSPIHAAWWRRAARHRLSSVDGLVFAKAMHYIGARAAAGFGGGLPALDFQILLLAWVTRQALEAFRLTTSAQQLADQRGSWWAEFAVCSTRGTHLRARPLTPAPACEQIGPFAALTLGRATPRTLPRFFREGLRLGPTIEAAEGLITACSAGNPLTGNCTVSVWQTEASMIDFAYGQADGHRRAAHRDPPILAEQLNARLRLRDFGGNWEAGTLHPHRLDRLHAEGGWSRSR